MTTVLCSLCETRAVSRHLRTVAVCEKCYVAYIELDHAASYGNAQAFNGLQLAKDKLRKAEEQPIDTWIDYAETNWGTRRCTGCINFIDDGDDEYKGEQACLRGMADHFIKGGDGCYEYEALNSCECEMCFYYNYDEYEALTSCANNSQHFDKEDCYHCDHWKHEDDNKGEE